MSYCEKVRQAHDAFSGLVNKFKNLDFKKDVKGAVETRKKLEAAIAAMKDLKIEDVHIRKRLAERLGYLYIGKFDETGLAIAFKERLGSYPVFITRTGDIPYGKEFHPIYPFKGGYTLARKTFFSYGQLSHSDTVVDRYGVTFPINLSSSSVSWHPNDFDRYRYDSDSARKRIVAVIKFFEHGKEKTVEWSLKDVYGNLMAEEFDDYWVVVEKDSNGDKVFNFKHKRY